MNLIKQLFLVVSLLISSCAIGQTHLPNIADTLDSVRPSTVEIFVAGETDENGITSSGRGSGFIFSEDGYILTNTHVVEGGDVEGGVINVELSNGVTYVAEIVGMDVDSDVALLKIDETNLPASIVGDSTTIRQGDWVIAYGNPYGFDNSASVGIISNTARSLPNDRFVRFIQIDAAINPGNSGGALFNLNGEVIGINSLIYSASGQFAGIAMAIPMHTATYVAAQLLEFGEVRRGWLGVQISGITQEVADDNDLDAPFGAIVNDITPFGPAAVAGFHIGDIILEFGGKRVESVGDLPYIVGNLTVGETFQVEIIRDGIEMTLDVLIAKLKPEPPTEQAEVEPQPEAELPDADPEVISGRGVMLGISVADQEIPEAVGVVIVGVEVDGPSDPELEPGDIVVQINGLPVTSVDVFLEIDRNLDPQAAALLMIQRDTQIFFKPISVIR